MTLHDVKQVLSDIRDNNDAAQENDIIQLLPHHKCACHSSNLKATTDADKALKTQSYNKIHLVSFSKCQAIWHLSKARQYEI